MKNTFKRTLLITHPKAFLEACSAAIGATALTPRERLVFLVTSWLGEDATRKDICEFTGISTSHLNVVLSSLEKKELVQNGRNIQNGRSKTSKMDETSKMDGNSSKLDVSTGSEQGGSSSSPSSSPPDPLNNNPSIISPKNPSSPRVRVREEDCTFDGFWKHYPRKVGKGKCREKWKELMEKKMNPRDILEGLFRILPTWYKYTKEEQEFIPHPITWLNQMRWEDEVEVDFGDFKPEPEPESTPQAEPEVSIFSENEKAFLDVYGKKPHSQEDIDLFHVAFKRALEEAGDIKVLCAAAQIAIETHMLDEGNTRRMKRASYWLDDCEYRQLLERAKASTFEQTGTHFNFNL